MKLARGFAPGYLVLPLDGPPAILDAANPDLAMAPIRGAKAAGAAVIGIFHAADVRGRVSDRLFTIEARPEASRSAA